MQQTCVIDIIRLASCELGKMPWSVSCVWERTCSASRAGTLLRCAPNVQPTKQNLLQSKISLLYLQCDVGVSEVASAGTPLTVCWIWKVQKQSALQDRARTGAGRRLQKNIWTTFTKQISPQCWILIRRLGLAGRPSAGPDLQIRIRQCQFS